MFNWRILLGGAASAAILTVGVAAPAFAVPRASSPVPLNGITQGVHGVNANGIFCALPILPVSVGVTAAANALGESCGSSQVNGSSQTFVTGPPQGSAPQAGGQDSSQSSGQTNGPARTTSAPQASGASSAMPGLNSISDAIPDLSNAASVVPSLGNVTGSVTSGNSGLGGTVGNLVPSGGGSGLGSVTGALGGVAGGISGGGQAGGPATGPLP